jgi:DDE superfamily endonuclease
VAEPDGSAIEAALDEWLAPFLAVVGRKTRRRWAPLYLHGLLGPDGRKSLQPLAARLGLGGHDQLQHFVASPAWDDAPLRRVLAGKAAALVGGPGAVLVVDDTALPKKGTHSVGAARQYCGALGKRATLMFVVNASGRDGAIPRRCELLKCIAVAQSRRRSRWDDGWQTLMRGLVTAFPCVRPGLPRSASGRRPTSAGRPHNSLEGSPPGLRPRRCAAGMSSRYGLPSLAAWVAPRRPFGIRPPGAARSADRSPTGRRPSPARSPS